MSTSQEQMATAATTTLAGSIGGGTMGVIFSWLTAWAIPLGTLATLTIALVAVVSLAATIYFKRLENTRKAEMHKIKKEAILKGIPVDG